MNLRIRRLTTLLSGLVLWMAICAGADPAAGQGTERIEDELVRTDETIRRVSDIVREGDSRRARDVIENAEALQAQAWERFRDERPVLAGQLTMQARALAVRAMTLAREDASLRSRAAREEEKAERAWEHAREQLSERPSAHALRLLDEARTQMDRGRLQFQEQHYEAALRLAVSAQSLIRQALGSAAGGSAGALSVTRELERTDRLIERVEPIVRESRNEEALRMLARAVSTQRTAYDEDRAGHPRVALATTREARAMASRALSMVRGGASDESAVRKAVTETDRILAQAHETIAESRDERAIELLGKAFDRQLRAREDLDEGEFRRALAETRVARSLAKRALRLADGEETP